MVSPRRGGATGSLAGAELVDGAARRGLHHLPQGGPGAEVRSVGHPVVVIVGITGIAESIAVEVVLAGVGGQRTVVLAIVDPVVVVIGVADIAEAIA